jgi:hypothetical protein
MPGGGIVTNLELVVSAGDEAVGVDGPVTFPQFKVDQACTVTAAVTAGGGAVFAADQCGCGAGHR